MKRITYDMLHHIEVPPIILSTTWHKHLGVLTNISESINTVWNMNSADEISFDVYKYVDGVKCDLWDDIVSFKYIYVPDQNAYYEIVVSVDETDNTVKHITAKAAGEVELSNRKLIDFHCNDETDILMDDYDASMPTVLYREILPTDPEDVVKKKKRSSLLHRVLADKCPDWGIGHVDNTICNIQRTYTVDNVGIYEFLTNTVAKEIDCLFTFDSVNRLVNAYDLCNICLDCGYRGTFADECPECGSTNYTSCKTCSNCGYNGVFADECPKCGSTHYTFSYGKRTGIFLNTENYATNINLSGNTDNVKNCLRLTAGDDLMTATVVNINPNGSRYIYNFSEDMFNDMPSELVDKIEEYNALYTSKEEEYADLTDQWYDYINQIGYLEHSMMPETPVPGETTASEQLTALEYCFNKPNPERICVQNISQSTSQQTVENALNTYCRVLIDPRYTVKVTTSSLSNYDENKQSKTWYGKFTVTSLGATDDDEDKDEATSSVGVAVTIIGGQDNYEKFLNQKIQKSLDRTDYGLMTLFDIEDDNDFKEELTKYSLERLKSFKNAYGSVCEILTKMEVTEDAELYFGIDLYNEMYMPYYTRGTYIEAEMDKRSHDIADVTALRDDVETQRSDIRKELDFTTFLGEDLFKIFSMYRKEGDYTNSNYISTNLENHEIIDKAREFFEVAKKEVVKSSETELTISESLNNLLNTKEFADYKDAFEIGDWLVTEIDDKLYRIRLIGVSFDYGSPESITFTFSNVDRMKSINEDLMNILNQSQSMAGTYNTVAHQAKQGDEANADVTEMQEDGLDSSKYNILAGANNSMVIDEHGLLFKDYDDIEGVDSPEQIRINNNVIEFTDDYWETVKAAVGKIRYMLNGEEKNKFGVKADALIAGLMIAGEIYSSNWAYDEETGDSTGTHFDLDNGEFSIGSGSITYKDNLLNIKSGIINWESVDAPPVTSISGLSEALNKKQNKLTAGENITIQNDVISSTGGDKAVVLSQSEYNALPQEQKDDLSITYYIYDGTSGEGSHNWYGTDAPLSDIGNEGDIYMQYSGNQVIAVFGKINSEWMPWAIGGSNTGHSVIRLVTNNQPHTNNTFVVTPEVN